MKLNIPKRFFSDQKWAYSHYGELMKKYGDQWIAVLNKKIVGASTDILKVEEQIKKKTESEYVPLIFIERSGHVY